VLPARVRFGSAWSDACILNISSRGMMIQASRGATCGSIVELERGDQLILARVIWRDGARAGLQVDDQLPVEDILSLSKAPGLQLTAADALLLERRKHPRTHDMSRLRARTMEFVCIALIGVSLCAAALSMAQHAFTQPLAEIEAAFGG
jgi:hypothetical protein